MCVCVWLKLEAFCVSKKKKAFHDPTNKSVRTCKNYKNYSQGASRGTWESLPLFWLGQTDKSSPTQLNVKITKITQYYTSSSVKKGKRTNVGVSLVLCMDKNTPNNSRKTCKHSIASHIVLGSSYWQDGVNRTRRKVYPILPCWRRRRRGSRACLFKRNGIDGKVKRRGGTHDGNGVRMRLTPPGEKVKEILEPWGKS